MSSTWKNIYVILAFIVVVAVGIALTQLLYSPTHPASTPHVVLVPPIELGPKSLPHINYQNQCIQHGTGCAVALVGVINRDRALHGAAPLILDWHMSSGFNGCIGAAGNARSMLAVGRISHDQFPNDIEGCITGYRTLGENVGMASSQSKWSAISAVLQLMLSEPWTPSCSGSHVCSLRSQNFTRIGLGFAVGPGGVFMAQEFFG